MAQEIRYRNAHKIKLGGEERMADEIEAEFRRAGYRFNTRMSFDGRNNMNFIKFNSIYEFINDQGDKRYYAGFE